MNLKHKTSIAAAISLAFLGASATPAVAEEMEQCYGVAKAGQNDCKAGNHECKGHSTEDYSGKDFKLVPKGSCLKMGGTTSPSE